MKRSVLTATAALCMANAAFAEDSVGDLLFRNVMNRAFPLMSAKWMVNDVAVCWENATDANAADRALIKEAVEDTWQASSKLNFGGWAACVANNKGIRVRFSDEGPHTKGLGTQIDGKPNGMVLNLSFANWSPSCASSENQRRFCVYAIAVHEFGHAIGFSHEQNRADTPGECLTREAPQGGNGDTLLTPWDPDSVMNYCDLKWNNNGKLSELDKYAVAFMYGRR